MDEVGGDLSKLEGRDSSTKYFEPTDKLGADVPFPKSQFATYVYATHVVILDDDGKVKEVYAAHDSGKVVTRSPFRDRSEGGVLMGMGYALTEDWPLKGLRAAGEIRHPGAFAFHPDPGHPCHLR